jgi:flagellar hook assembly protein FlgD
LINGQIYTAGIQAVYDLGNSDIMLLDFEFTGTGVNGTIINKTELKGNYPNPFNPITTISFSLNNLNTENSEIEIYNLKGQKVKKLEIRNLELGINNITWNGTDDNDQPVSSGIYLYKLIVNGEAVAMKKCLLLK